MKRIYWIILLMFLFCSEFVLASPSVRTADFIRTLSFMEKEVTSAILNELGTYILNNRNSLTPMGVRLEPAIKQYRESALLAMNYCRDAEICLKNPPQVGCAGQDGLCLVNFNQAQAARNIIVEGLKYELKSAKPAKEDQFCSTQLPIDKCIATFMQAPETKETTPVENKAKKAVRKVAVVASFGRKIPKTGARPAA